MTAAPASDRFPKYPESWYWFCQSADLKHKPLSRELLGRRLAAFRTSSGQVTIMDATCSHFGADLGQGCVINDRLQCPFHHWEYDAAGQCRHIPAQKRIPSAAVQAVFPTVERHGSIFFFSGPKAHFSLPFYEGCDPDHFLASKPLGTHLTCPWYLIGANAFDLQHFRAAHDRRLLETPTVDCPAPFARRATGTFSVSGDSLQDRFTRVFAGERVTLSITDWCGNLMFATATFRRTRSYGMVATEPTERGAMVRVIVFVPRSSTWVGRALIDPLHAYIRRFFIMRFLASDAVRLNGARYNPLGLIEADRDLADYFRWLSNVSHGEPAPSESPHTAAWRVEPGLAPTIEYGSTPSLVEETS